MKIKKDGFYRLNEVLELLPISRSTWYLGVKQGKYPQSYRLGYRITAWKAEDINKVINSYKLTSQTPKGKYNKHLKHNKNVDNKANHELYKQVILINYLLVEHYDLWEVEDDMIMVKVGQLLEIKENLMNIINKENNYATS